MPASLLASAIRVRTKQQQNQALAQRVRRWIELGITAEDIAVSTAPAGHSTPPKQRSKTPEHKYVSLATRTVASNGGMWEPSDGRPSRTFVREREAPSCDSPGLAAYCRGARPRRRVRRRPACGASSRSPRHRSPRAGSSGGQAPPGRRRNLPQHRGAPGRARSSAARG